MAVNPECSSEINVFSTTAHTKSPTPVEIEYNETTLACYIDLQNKFQRRNYMECRNNCSEVRTIRPCQRLQKIVPSKVPFFNKNF